MESKQDMREKLLTESPWKLMISLSLPAIIGMVVIGLYNFMDAVFVGNIIGSQAMAAVMSLQAFAFIPLWGISQGFQPAAGTNYGAKQYKRVKKFMSVFVISATVLAAVFYVPIMVAPKAMLSMFITDNPAIVDLGANMLRVLFIAYITYGFFIMSMTLFQSLGKAKNAAVMTILRSIVIFIPLVYLLPHIGGLEIHGLFLSQPVTDLIVLIIAIVMVHNCFRQMPSEK